MVVLIITRHASRLRLKFFIICVEIMASIIRENKDILGLQISQREHKFKQFADDCTCIVKPATSLTFHLDIIEKFTNNARLKLNLDKSLLGRWRKRNS